MKKRRAQRFRSLQCELLESRQMLSATATLSGSVLNVLGTDGDDAIKFYESGKNIFIQGVDGYWSASKVKSIYVDSKGGDDLVSVNSYVNGGNKWIKASFTVLGGAGTEQVSVGAAHDLYFSGQGKYAQIDAKGNVSLNGAGVNLANYATASFYKGVLTVTGTLGNDNLKFAQVKGNIYISGVSGSFKASKVNAIVVRLQDGNDSVSLDSLANGGNQTLAENVTIYSMAGNNTVRLANGHDVAMNGAHTLQVAINGTATLDGVVLSWDVPTPPAPPTPPNPPTPPATDWFTTHIQDAALRTLGSSLYADNVINRSDMIALLQNAGDNGGVDATELADLQLMVNTSSLFAGLGYVERLAEYVVLGSAANAQYLGQSLGNLAAGSSTAQLNNLVNKWFLGLDHPTAGGTYQQFSGQLFVNGVAYTDINQGQVGDCYLMESLAETALRSPSTITNMFIVNGDGTYTVKFFNYGQAEYVTVDAMLPTSGGYAIYAGMGKYYSNSSNELWTMLAEKAYVQANQFGWIRPGLTGNGQNAYSGIEGGYIYAATGHITGQSTIAFTSTASSANFTAFVTAWNAGKLIGFASKTAPASSSVVGSHAYAVLSYNSSAQTITLYNPWGPNYATVTMTWAEIGGSFSYFDRTA